MKKTSVTALILLACQLFVLLSCGSNAGAPDDTSDSLTQPAEQTVSPAVPEAVRLTENGKCVCRVIRSVDAKDDVIELAQKVRNSVRTALGCTVDIGNDFSMNGRHDPDTFEILVGETTYEQTSAYQDGILYSDFANVIIGHKIVIIGKTYDSLKRAVDHFVSKELPKRYSDDSGDVFLSFEPYEQRGSYPLGAMTINGNPIGKYRIVYPASGYCFDQLGETAEAIAAATGYLLPCVTDKSERSEFEIAVGPTNRRNTECSTDNVSVCLDGSDLVISCTGSVSADYAVKQLLASLDASAGKTDIAAGYSFSGDWISDQPLPRAEGTDLRIISANVLTQTYGAVDYTASRAEIFGRVLEKYHPDAAGMQEVCSYWRKYFAVYGGSYKMICTVRDDGVNNYSVIIYDSEKYEVVDSGVIPYSLNYNKNCRNMGWAILRNRSSGFTFGLISTHWDFDTVERDGDAIRKAEADELAAQTAKMAAQYNCPVFTTGDYNCPQDSASMNYFRSINNLWCNKFDSAAYLNNYGTSGGLCFAPVVNGRVIDYIFGTKNTSCLSTLVIPDCRSIEVSDHRFTCADIRING